MTRKSPEVPLGLSLTMIFTFLLSGTVKVGFIVIAAIFLLNTPFAWVDFFLLLILVHFVVQVIYGAVKETRKQKTDALAAFEAELERIARGR